MTRACRMASVRRWMLMLTASGLVLPRGARGQEATPVDRLDSATAAAVGRLVDSVQARGLPADQILAVAHEGALHRAKPELILAAVREYAVALESARNALGASPSNAEILSGAGLIVARVNPNMLTGLRAARPEGSLAVPLVVFADLVERGVTSELAFKVLTSVLRSGAPDEELNQIRAMVADAIASGRAPAAALSDRVPATTSRRRRPLFPFIHGKPLPP